MSDTFLYPSVLPSGINDISISAVKVKHRKNSTWRLLPQARTAKLQKKNFKTINLNHE